MISVVKNNTDCPSLVKLHTDGVTQSLEFVGKHVCVQTCSRCGIISMPFQRALQEMPIHGYMCVTYSSKEDVALALGIS